MPVRHTPAENRALRVETLRQQRLSLQKEIDDNVQTQQRVYTEVMKPNAAEAKLMTAQAKRGAYVGSPVPLHFQAALAGMDTPTARFEWARTEIDRISKLVTSKRNQLEKVEEKLAALRSLSSPPYIERVGFAPTVTRALWSYVTTAMQ